MRIDKIELCNFGSYVGVNTFDICVAKNRKGNIILIGGRNGAGKTTLFSGIKLCLYGNKAEGFQTVNAYYRKEVKKYFNDNSKIELNSECYVKLVITISNGQADDTYELERSWNINSELLEDFEQFLVAKNGLKLGEEELADFDNFIINLIPPELFELFFFDGEQIADYFLGEDGNSRVKNAFMVLCGYDTFDIMQKNFKRLTFGKKNIDEENEINYIEAKDKVSENIAKQKRIQEKLTEYNAQIESVSSEINELDKKYRLSGGVLYDEWSTKLFKLKEEERMRGEKNTLLKKMANDSIPFIILRELLGKLHIQLLREYEKQQMDILQESLKNVLPKIMLRAYKRLKKENDFEFTNLVIEEFDEEIKKKKLNDFDKIIGLSNDEYIMIQNSISRYLDLDRNEIIIAEQEIKNSLCRTQEIRVEMERSNIGGIQDFLDKKAVLLSEKDELSAIIREESEALQNIKQEHDKLISNLKREEKKFEENAKNQSINMLSEKAVAFLDTLQSKLYHNEIEKVQILFMQKIRELARKSNFIDEIKIDSNFNVHIFKRVIFDTKKICQKIKKLGMEKYVEEYGTIHCDSLLRLSNISSLDEWIAIYKNKDEQLSVLQEIEKSRLSKGEKQVFIMSLYWSFMQLNHHNVPFIIDTPFARIDTEHRTSIIKNFFMDLEGQVFIFSTNEEISGIHYKIIQKKIGVKFLLENTDNVRTKVLTNQYFGG